MMSGHPGRCPPPSVRLALLTAVLTFHCLLIRRTYAQCAQHAQRSKIIKYNTDILIIFHYFNWESLTTRPYMRCSLHVVNYSFSQKLHQSPKIDRGWVLDSQPKHLRYNGTAISFSEGHEENLLRILLFILLSWKNIPCCQLFVLSRENWRSDHSTNDIIKIIQMVIQ